jgi:catalase
MTNDSRKPTTTDAGIPVASDEHSLTVGPDGPILLQDHYLIEQMANFNRERTPERQPHAKGSGAFGRFEVTKDVSQYTKAALFQPGVKTDMLAGFRVEVLHESGQLRHGRERHAGILPPRSDEVPALHPFPEAPGRQQPARP